MTAQRYYGTERVREVLVMPKGKGRPAKPKAWSHDDELQAHKGKPIHMTLVRGGVCQFTLLEADRFTLKILDPVDNIVYTISKHSIASYTLLAD